MEPTQLIMLVVGVMCILSAVFNWNWWYESRKIGFIVKKFGRKTTRIIYTALGIIFISVCIIDLLDIKDLI